MKCLIIAAGRGSRLQLRGNSKPLIPIFGVPLIERVIRSAREVGADEFYVVTGYRGDEVSAFLTELSSRESIHITSIHNPDWQKENGLSVLKAAEHIDGPFLLLMADHIFDPEVARELVKQPLPDGEINLGVDRQTSNPRIDLDDVTKVRIEDGKIQAIGKELAEWNGFDTGIFVCTTGLFDALRQAAREEDDTSLSGGVRVLAKDGRANAVDIGSGRYWVDVDDPNALHEAEKVLLDEMQQ